jgi:hypothetical protein
MRDKSATLSQQVEDLESAVIAMTWDLADATSEPERKALRLRIWNTIKKLHRLKCTKALH